MSQQEPEQWKPVFLARIGLRKSDAFPLWMDVIALLAVVGITIRPKD